MYSKFFLPIKKRIRKEGLTSDKSDRHEQKRNSEK